MSKSNDETARDTQFRETDSTSVDVQMSPGPASDDNSDVNVEMLNNQIDCSNISDAALAEKTFQSGCPADPRRPTIRTIVLRCVILNLL